MSIQKIAVDTILWPTLEKTEKENKTPKNNNNVSTQPKTNIISKIGNNNSSNTSNTENINKNEIITNLEENKDDNKKDNKDKKDEKIEMKEE